ncbi:CHAT domain-containing protein [Streptomyces sp. NPDC005474]|uniref:CHAT domain-containing protein n=1 Tax=Streptomyces sp. NPDC005474 TaxID=3154878 RepID=UPI0034541995
MRSAVALADDEYDRRLYLSNLCSVMLTLDEDDPDPALVDAAVRAGQEAVPREYLRFVAYGPLPEELVRPRLPESSEFPPAVDPSWPMNLAEALRRRFVRSGPQDEQGIEDTIEAELCCRVSRMLLLEDEPDRAHVELVLGRVLESRYDRTDEVAALDRAVTAFRTAGAEAARHGLDPFESRTALADALLTRHDTYGGGSLAEIVDLAREAADAAPDPVARAFRLDVLGRALSSRFQEERAPSDAEDSVRVLRQALELLPDDDPERAVALTHLGTVLRSRGEITGRVEDARESVALHRRAMAALEPGDPRTRDIHFALASDLVACYELDSDTAALHEALPHARQALRLAEGDGREAEFASELGNILRLTYELTADPEHLREALAFSRHAVELAGPQDRDRAAYQSHLGNVLAAGYERGADRRMIDEAVEVARTATRQQDVSGPYLATLLSNLGNALALRYDGTGDLESLREAVAVCREATRAEGRESADSPGYLGNLGRAALTLYERTQDWPTLQEAVTACIAAVRTVPRGHQDEPVLLHALGHALFARYEAGEHEAPETELPNPPDLPYAPDHPDSQDLPSVGTEGRTPAEDLAAAVSAYRRAVAVCPPHDENIGLYRAGLGLGLLGQYEHTGDAGVLDKAVETLDAAVADCPPANPARAQYLYNLGLARLARGESDEARDAFRAAATVVTAAPVVRVRAGIEWGGIAADAGRPAEALRAFEVCAELLPRVTDHALDRTDQEHHLTLFPGLAAQAAASALQADEPERALVLLEQTRAVLTAQALRMRQDWSLTEGLGEDEARRLDELRTAMDAVGPGAARASGEQHGTRPASTGRLSGEVGQGAEGGQRYEARRQLVDTWDRLVHDIRERPGRSGFLALPVLDNVLAASEEGPVVLLNVHERRSDALVVLPDGMRVVELPGLTPDRVKERSRGFAAALAAAHENPGPAARREADSVLTDVLGWLWDELAEPVLATACPAGSGPNAAAPRRLWWASTGPLSALPLHAAGYHADGPTSGRTVLDRVISSYTPSIGTLRHLRSRTTTVPSSPKVLAVAMPVTPGQATLPATRHEMDTIRRHFGARATVLDDGRARRGQVRELLPSHSWAHFACHGVSDMAHPSAGRLLLGDDEQLTVMDVWQLRMDTAEFAFLSACETARSSARLPDEAIHITTAFQLAGFRQVVGTLWPLGDRIARRAVDIVYASLSARPGSRPDGARAVYEATRALRTRYADSPSSWAALVHAGV